MPTLTEAIHAGAFIVSEADGWYSRDQVTVALSRPLLGVPPAYKSVVAAGVTVASPVADAGNTGNGVFTMDVTTPVLAGAQNGNYRVVCIEPGTNVGTFEV